MKLVGVDEVRAENDKVWALRYSEHLGAESRGTSRMPELTVSWRLTHSSNHQLVPCSSPCLKMRSKARTPNNQR